MRWRPSRIWTAGRLGTRAAQALVAGLLGVVLAVPGVQAAGAQAAAAHTRAAHGGSAHAAGAHAASATWNQYLFPGPVSHSCASDAVVHAVTTRSTQVLDARYRTKLGTRYLIRDRTVVQTTSSRSQSRLTLSYLVTPSGQVDSSDGVQFGPTFNVVASHPVVYPALPRLLRGATASTRTVVRLTATNPALKAAFTRELGGKSTLDISLHVSVKGLRPRPVTTPAGRFTDTVGVQVDIGAVHFLNVTLPRAAQRSLRSGLFPARTTTWYAKGVGPVRSSVSGGSAARGGIPAAALAGCTGLAGVPAAPALPAVKTAA